MDCLRLQELQILALQERHHHSFSLRLICSIANKNAAKRTNNNTPSEPVVYVHSKAPANRVTPIINGSSRRITPELIDSGLISAVIPKIRAMLAMLET